MRREKPFKQYFDLEKGTGTYLTDVDYKPTDEETVLIMNQLSDEEKQKYNKDPTYRQQVNNVYHAKQNTINSEQKLKNSKREGVDEEKAGEVLANDENVQSVLRGTQENGIDQGLGAEGDKSLKERQQDARTNITINNGYDDTATASGNVKGSNYTGSLGVNSYKPKTIQQAYYDGDIDENERNFYIADSLANFFRNTGKDIGNIGAQFTGGSIDNNREDSLWNKEQAKRSSSEWRANQEARERDNITRAINNFSQTQRIELANQMDDFINSAKSKTERIAFMNIKAALLRGESLSDRDLAVSGGRELLDWLGSKIAGGM